MAPKFRLLTKRLFVIANITLVILLLLACMNAFLPPGKFWMIALLGLAFPFLLFLNVAFIILWLIARSRWLLLSLLALLPAYGNIRALVGFNLSSGFENVKADSSDIRILTWNVHAYSARTKEGADNSARDNIIEFIKEYSPDVIAMQEFLEVNYKGFHSNLNDIKALGYPYHIRVTDYIRRTRDFQLGVVLFSKYPILDTLHIRYPGPTSSRAAESLIAADILVNGKDTIRVYNTHLQSVQLKGDDFRRIEIIKNVEDSLMDASKNIIRKLRFAYKHREVQADIVRKELDKSPYPEIICGDFNDVPNSYTYFRIKKDRVDAFRQKGSRLGRTYAAISPTLRIDYIMADKRFKVVQYKSFVRHYSDHFPVMADLRLTKEQK